MSQKSSPVRYTPPWAWHICSAVFVSFGLQVLPAYEPPEASQSFLLLIFPLLAHAASGSTSMDTTAILPNKLDGPIGYSFLWVSAKDFGRVSIPFPPTARIIPPEPVVGKMSRDPRSP